MPRHPSINNKNRRRTMKTKNIFKTLAAAMLMPAMLLTASCSSEDELVINENTETAAKQGYTLPVTVNVARQGDDAATRATYNESTKKLEFSTGDKLFVYGQDVSTGGAGKFAGTLDYVSGGTFSGTITTQNEYSGTIDALFFAGGATATLLPAGYESYGYLSITNDGYDATPKEVVLNSFATSKTLAVEQLSFEAGSYTSGTGFALAPTNAILNFTITELTASKNVTATLSGGSLTISGNVTTDAEGKAIFAMGVFATRELDKLSLTVDGKSIPLVSESKTLSAGKIYNITRSAAGAVTDLSMVDCAGNARASQWTANCYMVHTAGDYKLPLVYGNAIKNGTTNAASYTGVTDAVATATFPRHDGNAITAPWIKDNGITVNSAELLWQDAEGLITAVGISGDYLTLTVGKDAATQEGNAVIAAKLEDGTVVWSWHIWVTNQTFASLTTVSTGDHNYQVTPVNLGWVSTGSEGKQGYNTFYQWGRKDAFIPSTGTANTNHTVYDISGTTVTGFTYTESTTATIADNIKNPTMHYYNSGNYGPCTTTYYNMWDAQNTATSNVTSATKKTVYDPSPAGFCVPTGNLCNYVTDGVTSDWDDANKGSTLTSVTPNVFFPASGCRYSGTLHFVGTNGYCWSASPFSSNYGYNLYFYNNNRSWGSYSRANGFPVRAVAEE